MTEPLPVSYTEEGPSSSLDVAYEVWRLAMVTFTAMASSPNPETAARDMRDVVTEAGAQVAEAEARLAVTLESWLGEAQQYLAGTVVAGLSAPLIERLSFTHESLHRQSKEEQ